MADTPEAPSTHEGGFKHFLMAQTGPLPNWVWGVVIVGTLGAVYVLPKIFGGGTSATSSNSNTPSPTSLAIDPTTGLPYATEGLMPAGGSITPANTTSNDMSALFQALQAQQAQQAQSNQDLLKAFTSQLQSFSSSMTAAIGNLRSAPAPAAAPAPAPSAPAPAPAPYVPSAAPKPAPKPAPAPAPRPAPHPLSAAQQAIDQWQAHTHQIWTGPSGSFPAGWGPTPYAPGAGVIHGGVFHYTQQAPVTIVNKGSGPIYRGGGGFIH